MTALWTSTHAAAATGGKTTADWSANGVSIDTRTIQTGDLFVALTDSRDGHDFVAVALEKGAAAALVTHRPVNVPADAPLLIVPDVLAALTALGVASRKRTRARVVGITGSVGKTSIKEMLRVVLSLQGKAHVAEASYNNHWGVPLTLARMPADADFAVIEIGMNHAGEIAPLAKMAAPHVVMITTVAAAHLEAFSSVDDIAHEKAAIMTGLTSGGIAILNADIPTTAILTDTATKLGVTHIGFGTTDTDWRASDVRHCRTCWHRIPVQTRRAGAAFCDERGRCSGGDTGAGCGPDASGDGHLWLGAAGRTWHPRDHRPRSGPPR